MDTLWGKMASIGLDRHWVELEPTHNRYFKGKMEMKECPLDRKCNRLRLTMMATMLALVEWRQTRDIGQPYSNLSISNGHRPLVSLV